MRAKAAALNSARASAVTSASSSQPMTSLMAAALMAMTPMGRRVILNSIMMRPRMGRAVMEKAVAMNSAEASGSTPGDSSGAVS